MRVHRNAHACCADRESTYCGAPGDLGACRCLGSDRPGAKSRLTSLPGRTTPSRSCSRSTPTSSRSPEVRRSGPGCTRRRRARSIAGHPADVATLDRKALERDPERGQVPSPGRSRSTLHTGRIEAVEKLRGRSSRGRTGADPHPRASARSGPSPCTRNSASASIADLGDRDRGRAGSKGCAASAPRTAGKPPARHRPARREPAAGCSSRLAMEAAEEIVAALSAVPGCERCAVCRLAAPDAGDHRRRGHPGRRGRLRPG